jgi:nicotinate-nucleotide adenylyltransferase
MHQNIGIYPGTFDPLHDGHIAFCIETYRQCHLDRILLLPERDPRNKPHTTDLEHRVTAITAAIKPYTFIDIAVLESSPFTAAHTIPELSGVLGNATLSLLIGSDIVASLHLWNDLELLFQDGNSLVVGMRQGDDTQAVKSHIQRAEAKYGLTIPSTHIHTDHAHLASSDIRSAR